MDQFTTSEDAHHSQESITLLTDIDVQAAGERAAATWRQRNESFACESSLEGVWSRFANIEDVRDFGELVKATYPVRSRLGGRWARDIEGFSRCMAASWQAALSRGAFDLSSIEGAPVLRFPLSIFTDGRTDEAPLIVISRNFRDDDFMFFTSYVEVPDAWQEALNARMAETGERRVRADANLRGAIQLTDSDEDIEKVNSLLRGYVASGALAPGVRHNVVTVNAMLSKDGYTVKGYSDAIWSTNASWELVGKGESGLPQGAIVIAQNSSDESTNQGSAGFSEGEPRDLRSILSRQFDGGVDYELAVIGNCLRAEGYDLGGKKLADVLRDASFATVGEHVSAASRQPLVSFSFELGREPEIELSPEDIEWLHGLLADVFGDAEFSSVDLPLLLNPPSKPPVFDWKKPGLLCELLAERGLLIAQESRGAVGTLYKVVGSLEATPYEPPCEPTGMEDSCKGYLESNIVSGALRVQSLKYWLRSYEAGCILSGSPVDDKFFKLGAWVIAHLSFPNNEDALHLGFTGVEATSLRRRVTGEPNKRTLPEFLRFFDNVPEIALPLAMVGVHTYWKERDPRACLSKALYSALVLGDASRVVDLLRKFSSSLRSFGPMNQGLSSHLLLTGRNMLQSGAVLEASEYFTALSDLWPEDESISAWQNLTSLLAGGEVSTESYETLFKALEYAVRQPKIIDIILDSTDSAKRNNAAPVAAKILSVICVNQSLRAGFLENVIFGKTSRTKIEELRDGYRDLLCEGADEDFLLAYILLQYAVGVSDEEAEKRKAAMGALSVRKGTLSEDAQRTCAEWLSFADAIDLGDEGLAEFCIENNAFLFAGSLLSLTKNDSMQDDQLRPLTSLCRFAEEMMDATSAGETDCGLGHDRIAQAFVGVGDVFREFGQSIASGGRLDHPTAALIRMSLTLFSMHPDALEGANEIEGFAQFAALVATATSKALSLGLGTFDLCRFYCYVSAFAHYEAGKASLALQYWERRLVVKRDLVLMAAKEELKASYPGAAFVEAAIECGGRSAFIDYLGAINSDIVGINKRSLTTARNEDGRWKTPNSEEDALFGFVQSRDPYFANQLARLAINNKSWRYRQLALLSNSLGNGAWQLRNMCNDINTVLLNDARVDDESLRRNMTFLVVFLSDFLGEAFCPALAAATANADPACVFGAQRFFPLVQQFFHACKEKALYSPLESKQRVGVRTLIDQLVQLEVEDGIVEQGRVELLSQLRLIQQTYFLSLEDVDDLERFAKGMDSDDLARLVVLLLEDILELGAGQSDSDNRARKLSAPIRVLGQDGSYSVLANWLGDCAESLFTEECLCSIELIKIGLNKQASGGEQPGRVISRYAENAGDQHKAVHLALRYHKTFPGKHDVQLLRTVSEFANTLGDFDDDVLRFIAETSELSAAVANKLQDRRDRIDAANVATSLAFDRGELEVGKAGREIICHSRELCDDELAVMLHRGLLFRNWGPLVDHAVKVDSVTASEIGRILSGYFALRPRQLSWVVARRYDRLGVPSYDAFVQSLDDTCGLINIVSYLNDAAQSGDSVVIDVLNRMLGKNGKAKGRDGRVGVVIDALNECASANTRIDTFRSCRLDELRWDASSEAARSDSLQRLVILLSKLLLSDLSIMEYFLSASAYKLSWLISNLDSGLFNEQQKAFMEAVCWVHGAKELSSFDHSHDADILCGDLAMVPRELQDSAKVLAASLRSGKKPSFETNHVGLFTGFAGWVEADDALTDALEYVKGLLSRHAENSDALEDAGHDLAMAQIGQFDIDDPRLAVHVRQLVGNCQSLGDSSRAALAAIAFAVEGERIVGGAPGGDLPVEALTHFTSLLGALREKNIDLDRLAQPLGDNQSLFPNILVNYLPDLFVSCAYDVLGCLLSDEPRSRILTQRLADDWATYCGLLLSLSRVMERLGAEISAGCWPDAVKRLLEFEFDSFMELSAALYRGELCKAVKELPILKSAFEFSYEPSRAFAKRIDDEVARAKVASAADVRVVVENEDYCGTVYLFLKNNNEACEARVVLKTVSVKSGGYDKSVDKNMDIAIPSGGLGAYAIRVDETAPGGLECIEIEVSFSDGRKREWTVVRSVDLAPREDSGADVMGARLDGYDVQSSIAGDLARIRFAGRDADISNLWTGIGNAFRNQGKDIVLCGPKGVGKTTLALRLAEIANSNAGLSSERPEYLFVVPIDGEIDKSCKDLAGVVVESAAQGLIGASEDKDSLINSLINTVYDCNFGSLEGRERRSLKSKLVELIGGIAEKVVFLVDEAQEWLDVDLDEFRSMRSILPNNFRFLFIGTGELLDVMTPQCRQSALGGMRKYFKDCSRHSLHSFVLDERESTIEKMLSNERVVGRKGFTDSAVEFLAWYTGGHARSCVKIGNHVLNKRGEAQVFIYAADVRDSALETAGEVPLVDDFDGEFEGDEVVKEIVCAFCMGIRIDGNRELSSGDVCRYLSEHPSSDGYSPSDDECSASIARLCARDYLTEGAGLGTYMFASSLFEDYAWHVYGRSATDRMNGTPKTSSEEKAFEDSQRELAKLEGINIGLERGFEKGVRLGHEARPENIGMLIEGDQTVIEGDQNNYVSYVLNIQNNISKVFGDPGFASLLGASKDEPEYRQLTEAGESIRALLPISASDSNEEVVLAQEALLDATLVAGMKGAMPETLEEVGVWVENQEGLARELGIKAELDCVVALVNQMDCATNFERESVLEAIRALFRSVLIWALFRKIDEGRGDYAACATPICRSFESILKSHLLTELLSNPYSRYVFEEHGQHLNLLSSYELQRNFRERYTLGNIHFLLNSKNNPSGLARRYHDGRNSSWEDVKSELENKLSEDPKWPGRIGNYLLLSKAVGMDEDNIRFDLDSYLESLKAFTDDYRNRALHGSTSPDNRTNLFDEDMFKRMLAAYLSNHDRDGLMQRTFAFARALRDFDAGE